MKTLRNQTAIVTGGAKRIGAALVRAFERRAMALHGRKPALPAAVRAPAAPSRGRIVADTWRREIMS